MLGNYQPSAFDLCFSLFGIPVRVTPMFWLGSVALGWGAMDSGPPFLLMWVMVCFVSILVHEMGHALVARWLGCQVIEAALYLLGGVAVYQPGRNHTQGKSILIALAGPGAGFILWGLMYFVFIGPIVRFSFAKLDPEVFDLVLFGIDQWLYVNLVWGLVNLLPVLPLDGGRVCQGVCNSISRYRGDDYARKTSIAVGGLVAVYFLVHQQTYPGILFLSLTVSNLQANSHGR
jgi:stage IV sporulation protein FB